MRDYNAMHTLIYQLYTMCPLITGTPHIIHRYGNRCIVVKRFSIILSFRFIPELQLDNYGHDAKQFALMNIIRYRVTVDLSFKKVNRRPLSRY